MSVDVVVYLTLARLPTPEVWQLAIDAAGFPLRISQGFNMETVGGLLPCWYQGVPSGFEYHPAILSREQATESGVPDADLAIVFAAHGTPREMYAALAASASLSVVAHGLLADAQSGELVRDIHATEWARECIAQLHGLLDST